MASLRSEISSSIKQEHGILSLNVQLAWRVFTTIIYCIDEKQAHRVQKDNFLRHAASLDSTPTLRLFFGAPPAVVHKAFEEGFVSIRDGYALF